MQTDILQSNHLDFNQIQWTHARPDNEFEDEDLNPSQGKKTNGSYETDTTFW